MRHPFRERLSIRIRAVFPSTCAGLRGKLLRRRRGISEADNGGGHGNPPKVGSRDSVEADRRHASTELQRGQSQSELLDAFVLSHRVEGEHHKSPTVPGPMRAGRVRITRLSTSMPSTRFPGCKCCSMATRPHGSSSGLNPQPRLSGLAANGGRQAPGIDGAFQWPHDHHAALNRRRAFGSSGALHGEHRERSGAPFYFPWIDRRRGAGFH